MREWSDEVRAALAAPFGWDAIDYRVLHDNGNKRDNRPPTRGVIAYYMDARAVMNRLDDVVGPDGWTDDVEVVDKGHVLCRLTVLGVTHVDVGEANEGGHADPLKAAVSDALKRAAVKFGIGRYLYDHDGLWVDLDKNGEPTAQERRRIADEYARLIDGGPARAGMQERPASDAGSPARTPAGPRAATNQELSEFWRHARLTLGFAPAEVFAIAGCSQDELKKRYTAADLQDLLATLEQHRAKSTSDSAA